MLDGEGHWGPKKRKQKKKKRPSKLSIAEQFVTGGWRSELLARATVYPSKGCNYISVFSRLTRPLHDGLIDF